MQQSVLISAIRGPDNSTKYGPIKMVLRWYRRCVLISALDGSVIDNPGDPRGGSFTGPSTNPSRVLSWKLAWEDSMTEIVDEYMKVQDALPFHYQSHMMHAIEILGYKHPNERIRKWWNKVYIRLVNALHLHPETEEEMDGRLGDTVEGWMKRSDKATTT